MSKAAMLRIVNTMMGLVFLVQVLTVISVKLYPIIPEDMFHTLHPIAEFVLIVLILIHIVFNWSWVKMAFAKKHKA